MERRPRKWVLGGFFEWFFLVATASLALAGSSSPPDLKGRKLVCYYANWAIYRPGIAKFTPENINPFLCTHLIYAFAGMNKDYELKPFDSYNDVQLGNFKKFTNLKTYNPKLKTMIAVGGWNEGSKRFSKMVESSESRSRFVRGALSFLRKHGFDGLDLDWEYPGSRDGGREGDKEGYASLVKELRSAFDSEKVPRGQSRLLLTMAVPAGKQYIDKGYDVPALSKNLDFLNLLTYDYHTAQEPLANHHAPLGEQPGLEEWSGDRQLNVEWTVKYYVELGCDPRKLVLGIPTYGRSFTLADPEETDLLSPAEGPGEKGEATREAGYLAYYEICQMIQDQEWDLEAPHPEIMGPFAYKDKQWVGFDDEDIIIEKVKFIVRKGLGGGMVWTLDNDDFRGKCYGEQSPLISTLKSALEEGDALLTKTTPKTTSSPKTTTQRTPRTQKSTTTSSPTSAPAAFTTPDPGPPFECEDEGFFNNPTDCKKYFWCLDSGPSNLGLVAHSFTCPSGLFFNKQRDSCDYAANVVCRVKKTTTVATTPRPRPKARTRKTTTTTSTTSTTTTTVEPETRKKQQQVPKNDLESALDTPNGQSLMELLQILQQIGVNQIHDKLHGRESSGGQSSTLSPNTLPEYRSPDRRRPTTITPQQPGLFLQYAKPDRTAKYEEEDSKDKSRPTRRPRGPQYHNPAPEAEEVNHDDLSSDEEEEDPATPPPPKGGDRDFPFVYHTPSRHRSRTTPAEDEDDEEEDFEDIPTTTSTRSNPTRPNRRVVVRVRPMSGEGVGGDQPENRRNNYVLAQTIGVRRQVRPNVLDEQQTTKATTPKPTSVRRARPATRKTTTTTTTFAPPPPPRYRGPPPPREPIVLQDGKPAVPATTRRRYSPPVPEVVRGPAVALLPDGGVTCLRRGVYPHPRDCAKFLACVPAADGEPDKPDGFIHDCPDGTYFMEDRGRCMPGDRKECGSKQ